MYGKKKNNRIDIVEVGEDRWDVSFRKTMKTDTFTYYCTVNLKEDTYFVSVEQRTKPPKKPRFVGKFDVRRSTELYDIMDHCLSMTIESNHRLAANVKAKKEGRGYGVHSRGHNKGRQEKVLGRRG